MNNLIDYYERLREKANFYDALWVLLDDLKWYVMASPSYTTPETREAVKVLDELKDFLKLIEKWNK